MKALKLSLYSKLSSLLSALLYVLTGAGAAVANENSFSGFVSQAVVYTSNNNFYGDSQDVSFDFTEVGVNGYWQFSQYLSASGQLLSRRAGKVDNGKLKVDYLSLNLSFLPNNDDHNLDLRLGRIKNVIGLYNETRDVSFTRPSIFLPQSIYFDRIRDLELSSDGAMVKVHSDFAFGKLLIDAGYGRPIAKEDTQINFPTLDSSNSVFSDEELSQARIWGEFLDGRLISALSWVDGGLSIDIQPEFNTILRDGGFNLDGFILSLQYDQEYWTFTGEYFVIDTVYELGQPAVTDPTSISYYLQAEYRINPDLNAFFRADYLYFDKNDRKGERYQRLTNIPGFTRFAEDYAVGLKWRFAPSWLLMMEFHQITGAAWITASDNPDIFSVTKHWSLISALVAFRF